ncbi:hypothetical protein TNCV_3344401 [Trichonephila clavipes]|nr:hypothetical protein TNCV_3344401 [Trichonephila clavipes]
MCPHLTFTDKSWKYVGRNNEYITDSKIVLLKWTESKENRNMEENWITDEEETSSSFFLCTTSACKVMATVFWDSNDVILIKHPKGSHSINADRYCAALIKLR